MIPESASETVEVRVKVPRMADGIVGVTVGLTLSTSNECRCAAHWRVAPSAEVFAPVTPAATWVESLCAPLARLAVVALADAASHRSVIPVTAPKVPLLLIANEATRSAFAVVVVIEFADAVAELPVFAVLMTSRMPALPRLALMP